jgi:hypothetical protein
MYGGQELAMQNIIHHAVLINSIPVAPDGSYIGAGGWTCDRGDKGAIEELATTGCDYITQTINVSQSVVRRVVELAALLKAGSLALKEVIKKDARYIPYLSRIEKEKEA